MASKTEQVLLTITIDTECDHDPRWVRSNPLSFDSVLEGIPNRLQPAFAAVGAIPTYLLTVEVLENPECVTALRDLSGEHEFGTHLHAAFVEPQKKFYDYAGVESDDFQSSYPADIEYQKLATLTNLFTDVLGHAPTSFRAGRYGASADSLNSLERLGYRVDTSVTPHLLWQEPNGQVDFRHAPEQPYFPSRADAARPEDYQPGRILEVPVTIKPSRLRREPTWFRPWFASVGEMKKIFNYYLKAYRDQPVLSINMMFHSMEVIEKASPYPQSPAEVDRFLADMQEVLDWCRGEGVEFVGLTDLVDHFRPRNG